MIKGKKILFGYGDVLVGLNDDGCMLFEEVKAIEEIGEVVDPLIYRKMEIKKYLFVKEDNLHELFSLFKTVNENNRVVKYKDIVFDFSKYNKESVDVCCHYAYKSIPQ